MCDYCGKPPKLVTGRIIYPHREDLFGLRFWHCKECEAWVGCHGKTCEPLGRLANKNLRILKKRAHRAFDPLWRSGKITRVEAYIRLANRLQIPRRQCHIGMFNEGLCRKVIKIARCNGTSTCNCLICGGP